MLTLDVNISIQPVYGGGFLENESWATWLIFGGGFLELKKDRPFLMAFRHGKLFPGKFASIHAEATQDQERLPGFKAFSLQSWEAVATMVEWARLEKLEAVQEPAPGKSTVLSNMFGRVMLKPETLEDEWNRIKRRLASIPSLG